MTEKQKQFIIGLEKLTRETGIAIDACGCCGSPFLSEAKITSEKSGYSAKGDTDWVSEIEWKDPSFLTNWEKESANIVKESNDE